MDTGLVINPSILSARFSNLLKDIESCLDHTNWIHFDVMDGHFVENISFGMPVLKSLRENLPKDRVKFDCHMMVSNPEKWVDAIADAGGDMYNFHYEATKDAAALIDRIHDANMLACMAIKPGTDVNVLFEYGNKLDMALIMTVEPGFGGQKFMSDMLSKVAALKAEFPNLAIEVDGGVGKDTIAQCVKHGANVLVVGSACFNTDNIPQRLSDLVALAKQAASQNP